MSGAPDCAYAGAALLHVSLLLALFGGAALATGARLKWDPSTYVVLRELLPTEYRVAAVALPALGAALAALGHLAGTALRTRRPWSRRLLLAHAGGMAALLALEVGWALWTAAALRAWLRSERAQDLSAALAVRDELQPLFHYLEKWHPLPAGARALLAEVQVDLPWNGYVAAAAAALVVLLQAVAVPLALLAARADATVLAGDTECAPLKPAASRARARAHARGRLVL